MNKKLALVFLGNFAIILVVAGGAYMFGRQAQSPDATQKTSSETIAEPPKDMLSCIAVDDSGDVYQTTCFVPTVYDEPFTYTDHLTCAVQTNLTYSGEIWEAGDQERGIITHSQSDYFSFSLERAGNELIRSLDPGTSKTENYTIIRENDYLLQAVRPQPGSADTAPDAFEFLTLSKQSGRGMEVWQNNLSFADFPYSEGIGSFTFACRPAE